MTFEEELLEELDSLVKSGRILVEKENGKYFSRLSASFPICGSKVDWDEVPGSIEEEANRESFSRVLAGSFSRTPILKF